MRILAVVFVCALLLPTFQCQPGHMVHDYYKCESDHYKNLRHCKQYNSRRGRGLDSQYSSAPHQTNLNSLLGLAAVLLAVHRLYWPSKPRWWGGTYAMLRPSYLWFLYLFRPAPLLALRQATLPYQLIFSIQCFFFCASKEILFAKCINIIRQICRKNTPFFRSNFLDCV